MSIPCDFIEQNHLVAIVTFILNLYVWYICVGGEGKCSSVEHVETVSDLFNGSLLYVLRYGLSLNLELAVSSRLVDE